jgi:hypothetical protein
METKRGAWRCKLHGGSLAAGNIEGLSAATQKSVAETLRKLAANQIDGSIRHAARANVVKGRR